MDNGFIKVASGTHRVSVGDVKSNVKSLLGVIISANKQKVRLLVTPELGITGYTLGDLFYFDKVLDDSINGLLEIAKATKAMDMLIFVGLPLRKDNKIYNTAAALYKGEILGFVPKTYLPNYSEFYEKRQFNPAPDKLDKVLINNKEYPFGTDILFRCKSLSEFCVGCEICEDLWVATPPSNSHALNGANIIVNLSASNETVSKADYRRSLVCSQSARLACGYIYSDAGEGESTTDLVFAGHNLIAENGKLLKETALFENGLIVSEIDVKFLAYEKSRLFNYANKINKEYLTVYFDMELVTTALTRVYKKTPFVPEQIGELNERAKLILTMQAMGLKKRLEHTKSKSVVFGISGGLDSCLTLLVAVRAMKLLSRPLSDIIAVTMPCFGTTDRTYNNACRLANSYGVSLKEINIKKSVLQHFADIGHDGSTDITYENAQARERTQVLMDVANQNSGFVLGTGDLSELALGWATYNGDHMSMYATNSSIPKTLVRHLVKYEASLSEEPLKSILFDILDTPVSPELLPAKEGEIDQKTEEIVGPYILHDFFLFCLMRMGFSPKKIFFVAKQTFKDDFTEETIKKWLKTFINRFFFHQFKRNCMPDGIKVGSVSISPRGDWRMPSDAVPFSTEDL